MVFEVANDIGMISNHFEYESTEMKNRFPKYGLAKSVCNSPKDIEVITIEVMRTAEACVNSSNGHHT